MTDERWLKLRSALLGSAALAVMAAPLAVSPAFAQDENAAADDEDTTELEEVLVTGSRIKRAGFDTLQPAIQVDAQFIDDRGFTNVAQALNEIPAFGIPGSSNTGGQSSQSVGQNFVNAFGLGSQRTLTLINGRRTVGQNTPTTIGTAASAGLQVDLNIIPTALIDRIETIFIGGAPIYGSDAVAATVNIILKDDYEGVSMDTQFGIADRGDSQNFRIRGLIGGNFANGRGNAVVSAEFVTVKALRGTDRQRALDGFAFCTNPASQGNSDGIPDNVFCKDALNVWQVPNTGLIIKNPSFISGLAFPTDNNVDGGTILNVLTTDGTGDGDPLVFDEQGNLVTFAQANLGTPRSVFFGRGAGCGTNKITTCLPETNTLISPLDRWIISGNAHYALSDNTRIFVETLFARTVSNDTNSQPPWSIGVFGPGAQGLLKLNINDNPFITEATKTALETNGVYDPTATDDPSTLDDNQFLFMNRSNIDIVKGSPRDRTQQVLRIVSGLEGEVEFFGNEWNWDTSYSFGVTDALARQSTLNGNRYGLALDAVVDPSNGQIVCRSKLNPLPFGEDNSQEPSLTGADRSDINGCLPFNPFGTNRNSQDVLDYLVQQNFQSNQIRQQVLEANIAGTLFEMPAGPLSVAVGITHRREDGRFDVAQASEIGIDTNSPVTNVAGRFNTKEIYGETLIPIIEGGEGLPIRIPFIDSLSIEASARFVDNSRAGNDVTWTAGGRLRLDLPFVGTGIQLRGNFTRSIRSPSIPELFLPTSKLFTFAQDPCDPRFIDSGVAPAVRRANCEAQFAQFASTLTDASLTAGGLDTFTSIIVNASQPGTTGGNINLKNEVADAFTFGGVLQPEFIPGLTVSIDYTSIDLSNAIVSISGTQLLNDCFDSTNFPNNVTCSMFTRDPTSFQIRNPELPLVNAALRQFRGLVTNISYNFAVADIPFLQNIPGDVKISANIFNTFTHQQSVGATAPTTFEGQQGFEKTRMQWNFQYNVDRFSWLFQALFTDGGNFNNAATAEFRDISRFPSFTVYNTTFRYQLTDNVTARVVINNILDHIDPPLLSASIGGNSNLFNDIVGRRFIFGLNASF